jgi:hypothetical protein
MLVTDVSRTKRDRTHDKELIPRGTSLVGVSFTPAHTLREQIASLSFFPSVSSARQLYAADASLRKRFPRLLQQWKRNVVILWTPNSYSPALRSILYGCLRTVG